MEATKLEFHRAGKDTSMRQAMVEWISESKKWQSFLTLTFPGIVSQDKARRGFQVLVRSLNQRFYKTTEWNHQSYFSYCVGVEAQERGSFHCHAIVDQFIDFALVHSLWGRIAGVKMDDKSFVKGIAWIQTINDSAAVTGYVTKYLIKGGIVDVYLRRE